jgi:hypothetical protein
MNPSVELTRLRDRWPAEFNDGTRCAFLQRYDGDREKGGYPRGFHRWPLDRRNAWYAGFNRGRCDRLATVSAPLAKEARR